jgi:hypothetical protein
MSNAHTILAEKSEGRGKFGEFDLNGKEISKCISRKCGLNIWIELNWLTIGLSDGCFWLDDKSSDSLKLRDFLTGSVTMNLTVPCLRRPIGGFQLRRPAGQVRSGQIMWDLWWTMWYWDRLSPRTWFPLQFSFH